MKKIILAMAVLVSSLMADVVVGGTLGYGNMDAEATAGGVSATADTKYTSLELKAGYQWEQARALVLFGSDNYKDDMGYEGEKNANYFGIEVDYLIPANEDTDIYAGVVLTDGSKDFVVDTVGFKDFGVKFGAIIETNDGISLEVGAQVKNREYDNYMGIDMEDDLVGVFVGLNFML